MLMPMKENARLPLDGKLQFMITGKEKQKQTSKHNKKIKQTKNKLSC